MVAPQAASLEVLPAPEDGGQCSLTPLSRGESALGLGRSLAAPAMGRAWGAAKQASWKWTRNHQLL